MTNANHDNTPEEYIKNPKRMPNTEHDKIITDKENATTQKPK